MQRILNIPIDQALLESWANWLAPEQQPFYLTEAQGQALKLIISAAPSFSPEGRDTFKLWGVTCPQAVMLNESDFLTLPLATRTELLRLQLEHGRGEVLCVADWRDLLTEVEEQAGGEHFVWWPSLLAGREWELLAHWSSQGRLPCEHQAVPEEIWSALRTAWPRVREIAGTFPSGSGPNCFGTVMAGAGVRGAEHQWMLREPFEDWLAAYTAKTTECEAPGTVLVWRDGHGQAQHAALVLGGGYGLHKPSQGWDSPRQALRLNDLYRQFDVQDRVLSCYTLRR
ncbi:hypothetical protein [Deinococcus humi]|uniref:Uncharacterized protein n=1 Tax=Deinococcus humi TaxID=662880 RepID=A0A7W8K055_9DEIO|nr:hypothetical protein [Deinococcus humi]MBB5366427.1 hypothetical protein [Deinococcus humi]GGO41867.1 hypothetical protein GCM10008949_53210 [Deinococcus humi]